ncbi:MAG: TraR/DksA family transcriptional regulator, partial [Blastocatellia bacterium]
MEKHTAIQSLLREKYAELQARLTRITRDVRHTEQPPEADAEERATAQENDEVLDGLEQKIRDEMK